MTQAVSIEPSRRVLPITVQITEGTALTTEIDLRGYQLRGIIMPAGWTAANLTFQASDKAGGTFQDVYDDAGTEVVVTAAASRVIGVDKAALRGLNHLKVRSGPSATPVLQSSTES